jgi:anthranilate synthase component I
VWRICKLVCLPFLKHGLKAPDTNNIFLGGGIVFDSDPYDEYMESMNKLRANITTIGTAEKLYTRLQNSGRSNKSINGVGQEALPSRPVKGAHIDLSAG